LNRSSVTDTGVTTLYSPNALNQYTSMAGSSLSYDNNFNLTHMTGFNGIYDAGNLLVAASNGASLEVQQTIAGFVYDGLGRCVKRTFNGVGTILVYDGWKPIGEWDATVPDYFQAWNVYGPGPDEILLRQGGKYGYMRFHLDRHGNVAFLVDNDGVIQEKYTYDVFGKPKIMDAAGTQRPFSYYGHCFLFQGREYIRELGIYDYRHRFYNPELGNFIQVDPIGLQTEGAKLSAEQTALYGDGAPSAFSSSELNLYRYCHDDPVNESDSTGLDATALNWASEAGPLDITRSGNWGDRTTPDFYKLGLTARGAAAEGVTIATIKEAKGQDDGGAKATIHVDVHVLPSHRGDAVDKAEQDHPDGFKKLLDGISNKVLTEMVADKQAYKSLKEFGEGRAHHLQRLFYGERKEQDKWHSPGGKHDYNGPAFKKQK
jgi:RHS repeat-associated protein